MLATAKCSKINMENTTTQNANLDSFQPEQHPSTTLSFGEKAVGLNFNPSGDDAVGNCKKDCAKLIDQMNGLRAVSESQEQKRLCSVAITDLQGAQMWAVKALTWKD